MAGLFDLSSLFGGPATDASATGDPNASGLAGLFGGLGQAFTDAQGNPAPALGNGATLAGGPTSAAPLGFMGTIGANRNALIGLGLGLMGGSPWNRYGPALQGFESGAKTDIAGQTEAQRNALAQQELAYRKQQDAVVNALRQKQFEFSTMSDAARAAQDLGLKPNSPEGQQFMTMYYRNKSGMQPTFQQIGEDIYGNKQFGFVNPANMAVTAFNSRGGQPGQQGQPAAAFVGGVPYVDAGGALSTSAPTATLGQPTATQPAATNVGGPIGSTTGLPTGADTEAFLRAHPEIDPKEYRREQTKIAVQKATTQQQMQQSSGPMINILDRAANLVSSAHLPTTGAGGAVLTKVPGTAAHDLGNLMDTIKANTAFDKLQEMRQNSPTGGALGQISNMEEQMLSKSVASLEQSQSKNQFLQNLAIVRDRYQRFHDSVNNPAGYLSKYGSPTTVTQTTGAPSAPSARSGGYDRDAIRQELIRRGVNPPQ